METKNAIDVKDLKISYRCLKSFSIKRSLLKLKKSEVEVFEAVKGVSFSFLRGNYGNCRQEWQWKIHNAAGNRRYFFTGFRGD